MRKPDIKFKDKRNNIEKNRYNNIEVEEPEEEKIIYEEPQYEEEEPQESSEDLENYYIEDEND